MWHYLELGSLNCNQGKIRVGPRSDDYLKIQELWNTWREDDHVKAETESEWCSKPKNVKSCQQPSEAGREAWNRFSLRIFRTNQLCQHLYFRLLESKTLKINFCCSKLSNWWCVVTASLGNEYVNHGVYGLRTSDVANSEDKQNHRCHHRHYRALVYYQMTVHEAPRIFPS